MTGNVSFYQNDMNYEMDSKLIWIVLCVLCFLPFGVKAGNKTYFLSLKNYQKEIRSSLNPTFRTSSEQKNGYTKY